MKRTLLIAVAVMLFAVYGYAKDTGVKDVKIPPRGKWSTESVYKCHRASSPIVIDGILDDPAWEKAEIISDLWQARVWEPSKNTFAPGHFETQKTKARLLYDDKYVYVSAEMEDSDVLGMTTVNESEFNDGQDDIFEVFFKPELNKPGYYEFHVLPQNVHRDLFFPKYGPGFYYRYEKEYQSGIQTAVKIDGTLNNWRDTDKGWTVELRIPMEAFGETGGGPIPGDRWQFLVSRYNWSIHLPKGLETVQMIPFDFVDFHAVKTYPTIEFVK